MAESGPSLGDFFAKKNKKKIVGSNLNKEATAAKPAPKKKAKDAEEDGWEEEQVVAATMKVEVAGKLMREEDKKEEEDTTAPAWGSLKNKDKEHSRNDLTDKKFPTLAKSVQSSNINIDDGSDAKVNIATSKNVFAALETHDDDEASKRPTEIKPAMVQKKKGERTTVALQREIDKYSGKKEDAKKDRKGGEEDEDDEDEDEEEDDAGEEREEKQEAKAPAPKKKQEKKEVKAAEPEKKEVEDDVKIQPDLVAAKAKYDHRKKLPKVELPAEELVEEKENKRPVSSKKKWANIEEDDKDRKLAVLEED